MFEAMRDGDMLLHHPFDAFDDSVVRFFHEAADDPDVTSIETTLYRVGNPSPVVEALLTAARAGKRVFALVELQARFDEEHNVHWARTLERAGGRVVYGLTGLKVHAKAASSPGAKAQGSGTTCMSAPGTTTAIGSPIHRPELFSTGDRRHMGALFATLATGLAPQRLERGALVAPHQLLPALLDRIERERAFARAGRPAAITIKVNGLADTEIVRALCAASQDGVRIDLIVRGICTLRPGVPGHSSGIPYCRSSGASRALAHLSVRKRRCAGIPDRLVHLRPRNLRRRVELLVPSPIESIEPASM
jgi:polyphosphate kinase